jgi:hypothetical protein
MGFDLILLLLLLLILRESVCYIYLWMFSWMCCMIHIGSCMSITFCQVSAFISSLNCRMWLSFMCLIIFVLFFDLGSGHKVTARVGRSDLGWAMENLWAVSMGRQLCSQEMKNFMQTIFKVSIQPAI